MNHIGGLETVAGGAVRRVGPGRHDAIEDVTVEVFNGCGGTCTGCLLDVAERRAHAAAMSEADFTRAARAMAERAAEKGIVYRAVLSFGDMPNLPHATQDAIYGAAADHGIRLGATMTMVEEGQEAHYREGLRLLLAADPEAVFDITVDPVRLERNGAYRDRVAEAIDLAPETHLAVLLSTALLERWSPEALAELWLDRLGDTPVILGFTPSLANLELRNYGYDIRAATDYARRVYARIPAAAAQARQDLACFLEPGSYAEHLSQRFHIAPDLSVYPVSFSALGDINLDRRSGGSPLGNLRDTSLADCLDGPRAKALAVTNAAWMERGDFGCGTCRFRAGCEMHGVGLARRVYRQFESKTGACYGPLGMGAELLS